jgi:DsbC/DsbD-like thiol-disulfide interchange protein
MSVALAAFASTGSHATVLETPWLEGYNSKTRLIAGLAERDGQSRLWAFLEIALPEGWKTYWRNPGDAGGLPPTFDWSKSDNLAAANILYPAPQRLVDRAGNTIGYKGGVVFPVEIDVADRRRGIGLAVFMQYGICKEICVPVEAELALDVPPGAQAVVPAEMQRALDRVPRPEGSRRPDDPVLKSITAELDGARPHAILEAQFKGDPEYADVFLEASGGPFVPLPTRTADKGGGLLVFEADLSKDVDLDALRGRPITATLVGETGASVASFRLR